MHPEYLTVFDCSAGRQRSASIDMALNVTEANLLIQNAMAPLSKELTESKKDLDTFFLLWAGALIFLMQAGFATLSAGSIREKNVGGTGKQSIPRPHTFSRGRVLCLL